MNDRPFDPGLQPERTELAWRRTALSVAVGSLVAMRLLPAVLDGVVWVVPGVLGLMIAAAIWVRARTRYVAYNRALQADDLSLLPDGRLLLGVAALCAAAGVLGLAIAVVLASRSAL
jgi:uncharacterized membrane protein YidH (DUF202 family)